MSFGGCSFQGMQQKAGAFPVGFGGYRLLLECLWRCLGWVLWGVGVAWGLWYDFVVGSYRRFWGGESVASAGVNRNAVRDRVLGLSDVLSCYAQVEVAAWDKTDEVREFFAANSAELGLGEYRLEFCVSNRLADDELAVVDGDLASEVVLRSGGAVSVFGIDSEWNMAVKFKRSCGYSRAMSGCFAFAPVVVYEGCGISGIGAKTGARQSGVWKTTIVRPRRRIQAENSPKERRKATLFKVRRQDGKERAANPNSVLFQFHAELDESAERERPKMAGWRSENFWLAKGAENP